ncbi:hypothetical protein FJ651_15625, partial [Paucihalobacter ruber]
FAFKIGYNEGTNPLYNGNISLTQWRSANTDNSLKTYSYTYDALNRIKTAIDNLDRYSLSNVSYDKNGNILSLTRKGHIVANPVSTNSAHFDTMDNLTYTYQANSNKLLKVSDAIVTPSAVQGEFKDDHNQTTPDPTNDYTYDANGNMKTDTNKGITNINYNHLNLPVQISINGMGQTGTITYIYDATGVKMRKTVSTGATTDYAGNYIYENGTLKFFSHPEGYVEPDGTNFDHVYQYKDHLGNIRLNYKDISTTSTPILEIIEENNYYPFGLQHKGYNNVVNGTENNYQTYSGKELNEELGLNWLDYGWRNYDASIAKWMNPDPLAEQYYAVSPYTFVANSPIVLSDPNGKEISFSITRDENGEITGVNINVTGKIIDETGKLSQKQLERRRDRILKGFSNIKVEGDGVAVSFTGNIDVASSESDIDKSDHVYRIVDDIKNVPGNGHVNPKTDPEGFTPTGQNVVYLERDFTSRTAAHETFTHSAGLYHIWDATSGGQSLSRYDAEGYASARETARSAQYPEHVQKAAEDYVYYMTRQTFTRNDLPKNLTHQSSTTNSSGNSMAGNKVTRTQVRSIIYNVINGRSNKGKQKSQ